MILNTTGEETTFPNYKSGRKKGRENDSKDWDAIFNCLNKIKSEFKENLPYKYVEVYGADDMMLSQHCVKTWEQIKRLRLYLVIKISFSYKNILMCNNIVLYSRSM